MNEITETGLYHGLCSLHPDFKPLVCALSPLTRQVTDTGTGPVKEVWSFLPPVEGCPGCGQGELLPLLPPVSLKKQLEEEVTQMRRLLARAIDDIDEETAWKFWEQVGGIQ